MKKAGKIKSFGVNVLQPISLRNNQQRKHEEGKRERERRGKKHKAKEEMNTERYSQARDRFIDDLGHKPPDDGIIEICLGRTFDRTKKGRRQTRDERISGQFLLDIDQPDLVSD